MKTKVLPISSLNEAFKKLDAGQHGNDREVYVYKCKLVTPLFGGGVKAGEVDSKMPIRATAIRGQLRFWWRLLKQNHPDKSVNNSQELFKAERAIWGGLGDSKNLATSKVIIQINTSNPIQLERRAQTLTNWVHRAEGYALFAAFDREIGINPPPPQHLGKEFEFTLSIGLVRGDKGLTEKQCSEVLATVQWWATFGGIGARTRRGTGSVLLEDIKSVTQEEVQTYGFQLLLSTNTKTRAIDAWHDAIDKLRLFRQGLNIGRNASTSGSKSPAGRSRWPEPDAIRRLTKKHCQQHKPEHPAGEVFPRAAFGMPIIFHFKDQKAGDPADTQLLPQGRERMASPIILRAYHLENGNWTAACLALPYTDIYNTELELKGNLIKPLGALWENKDNLSQSISPMRNRGTDPINAFLHYFREGN